VCFVCWHGIYVDVISPMLCNVTVWMQINTNTSTSSKVNEIFQEVMFHTCNTTEILGLYNVFRHAVG
jgi:hypothetical protein